MNGVTVFQKYVDEPVAIVYLLTPEEAWELPTALGQTFDPDPGENAWRDSPRCDDLRHRSHK